MIIKKAPKSCDFSAFSDLYYDVTPERLELSTR